MFLHEKLKECRESLGFSQDDVIIKLANAGCRVSRPTLTRWETGGSIPDANDLVSLGMVFNKPLKYFFAQNNKVSA